MAKHPSNSKMESEALERAAQIRTAIEREHETLLRSVALLVAKTQMQSRWPEVMEVASEILQEAIGEALKHAADFDPTRSATAWIRGIAARLLQTRRRAEARARRCVPASVLGDETWLAVLGQLSTGSADAAVAARLDLEQVLGRMTHQDRQAIEYRYYRGLDGEALANALGVATAGAARVRVCRALAALRARFRLSEEVLP